MAALNYSTYAIPAAFVLSILPHHYAIYLSKTSKDLPPFQNKAPREFIARCRALEKQSPTVQMYLRAEAASMNGFENLALFAASVCIGHVGRLPVSTQNKAAGVYLLSRAVYNLLYIFTTRERYSIFRTVAYCAGVVTCFTLFVKAGNKMNKGL